MTPWRRLALAGVIALLGGGVWLWRAVESRRPHGSDADQIRSLIAEGARAAGQRNPGPINRMISDHWDGLGLRAEQIRPQISRYLHEAGAVRVYVPANSIQIAVEPGGRSATASFNLQFQAADSQAALPGFDGTMEIRLAREPVRYYWIFPGQEWKVVSMSGVIPDFLAQ